MVQARPLNRRAVAGLILGLAALLLGADYARAETMSLRVMTYNIHHGEGIDGKLDLDRIASVIKEHNPDVALIQEVDRNMHRTGRVDTPTVLGEKTGLQWAFEPNLINGDENYGNATFLKDDIQDFVNPPLPNPNNAEPRGCLVVRFTRAGRNIYLMNTHLGLKPDERKAQCAALVNFVGRLRNAPTKPDLIILGGDLNETSEAEGLKLLLAEMSDTFPKDGKGGTIGKGDKSRRIDFILTSPGAKVKSARIIDDAVTRLASDHLPYLVDLEIEFQTTPTATATPSATATATPTPPK